MTAKQAAAHLNHAYPKLQNENIVLWAKILNLFDAIEETTKKCKPPPMKATIYPTRVRPFSEHGEKIEL